MNFRPLNLFFLSTGSHTYIRIKTDMTSAFAAKVDQIIIDAINANEDFLDAAEAVGFFTSKLNFFILRSNGSQ